MKTSEWPTKFDPELERQLEATMDRRGVRYVKENRPDWNCINYEILTKPELEFELSLQLYSDQLHISFDGCYLMLELALHTPKFRENPRALEEWKEKCLREVTAMLGSDLKVKRRTRFGKVLGGLLYRRIGNRWHSMGGAMLIPFTSRRRVKEYRSWLA